MRTDAIGILPLLAIFAGCAALPPPAGETAPAKEERPAADEGALRALLAYYATVVRNPPPLPRERPAPASPAQAMQQAIQSGQSRPPDLARALQLLDAVQKSAQPEAVALRPLARLLHDQYSERLRGEQQLREAQRRSEQLQEKIDALADIERRLPVPHPPPEVPR